MAALAPSRPLGGLSINTPPRHKPRKLKELALTEVHYGVVRQDGAWTIIGENLRFGAYKTKAGAERAARRLAHKSSGLPVQLHVQDELGELQPPDRLT